MYVIKNILCINHWDTWWSVVTVSNDHATDLISIIYSRKNDKIKLNTKSTAKKYMQYLIFCNIKCHIFDYVDTVDELNISLKYYHQYYHSVKSDLKSEPACQSIEKVFFAIQNNFQYVACCYFKDVCTFNTCEAKVFSFK